MGDLQSSSDLQISGAGGPGAPSFDEVVGALTDLPTLAPIAVRIIELADDENVSIDQLTDVIATDPGLAARLLRLANSAAYSSGRAVTNLNRAAMLLGLRTLKMVTLGFSLVAGLAPNGVDTQAIWRRSLAGGVLARRLGASLGADVADDAFVAGLLSNLGKLALASVVPGSTDEPHELANPWLSAAEELRRLGYTTDSVTARLLTDWGLPGVLADAVRTRSGLLDVEQTPLGQILQVADAAAVMLLTPDDVRRVEAYDAVTAAAAAHLGMPIGDLEPIIEEVRPELDAMAESFELSALAPLSVDEILRSAQTRLASLSLDIASQLTEEQQRNEALVERNNRLAEVAATDPLTGLPNRRTFDAFMTNQVAGRLRNPRATMLGLIVLDLDNFKLVNDNFGHRVGDEVIQEVGRRLLDGTRQGELSARIGGEEFAVILPDVTAEELVGAAERLHEVVGGRVIDTGIGPLSVTVSLGGACVDVLASTADKKLFDAADSALYVSKDNGRDQVTIAASV